LPSFEEFCVDAAQDTPPLSGRQLLVLQLLGRGHHPDRIAWFLQCETAQVERHARQAAARLCADDVEEAVQCARRQQLIV